MKVLVTGGAGLPRSLPIIDGLLTLFFVGGTRFSVRAAEYWQARTSDRTQRKRVLIVGAGDAGAMPALRRCVEPAVSHRRAAVACRVGAAHGTKGVETSSKGAAEGAGTYGAREELFSDDEALAATEHEIILVVSNGAEPSPGQWKADVEALLSLARAGETEKARERLRAIVCPPNPPVPP